MGPVLVLIATLLWGTDALVRSPTAGLLSATGMVLTEHVIGLLLLAPVVLYFYGFKKLALNRKQLISALFVGVGGSAVATVLFTASFRFINPAVAILIQKIQPIVVMVVAYALLGERPRRGFYKWAALGVAAALVLSLSEVNAGMTPAWKGIGLALAAASLWAVATVIGKRLLRDTPVIIATFWRYIFGTSALFTMLVLRSADLSRSLSLLIYPGHHTAALLYLSLVTGVLPLTLYYAGLKRTQASTVALIELLSPLFAVVLSSAVLHKPLSFMQVLAGAALMLSVHQVAHGLRAARRRRVEEQKDVEFAVARN